MLFKDHARSYSCVHQKLIAGSQAIIDIVTSQYGIDQSKPAPASKAEDATRAQARGAPPCEADSLGERWLTRR